MTNARRSVSIDRLAETEYARLGAPEYITATPFGRFVHYVQFPKRYDANQLMDCRCREDQFEELMELIDELHAETEIPWRKISGHDPATFQWLYSALKSRGWDGHTSWMMAYDAPPKREPNPDIRIETSESASVELARETHGDEFNVRAHAYHAAQDFRIGGEVVTAYLGERAVGMSGWFVVNGVARFRGVHTHESARGQGVATTMIRYVQEHPTVREQDALAIFCNDDGPIRLYEELGFRKRARQWECMLNPPE